MRAFNFKIFARYGTTEKVLISCSSHQHSDIQKTLSEKYCGDWLLVDSIDPFFEILHFNDGQEYKGWSPDIERYSDAIDSIVDPISDIKAMASEVAKFSKILVCGAGKDLDMWDTFREMAALEEETLARQTRIGYVGVDLASGEDQSIMGVYADGKLIIVQDMPPIPFPSPTFLIDDIDLCMLEKECYYERLDIDEVVDDKKAMRFKSKRDGINLYRNPYLKKGIVNNKNKLRRFNKNSKIR